MKKITIYSIGSCNTETRIGNYETLLEYGNHRKYLAGRVEDTTANRCIIIGFIEAVRKIKEPCRVELVSTTQIGLSGLRKNKGSNIDLIKLLISILSEKDCTFEFSAAIGRGDEINAYIRREQK